ncbi:MAG: hypothetical protein ACR2GD_06115 [Pyrinomonadaceae bacterium]
MAVEEKENRETEAATDKESFGINELSEPRWSVVSFESVAVSGVSYNKAVEFIEKLNAQKVSGLCIITDEAAARVSK